MKRFFALDCTHWLTYQVLWALLLQLALKYFVTDIASKSSSVTTVKVTCVTFPPAPPLPPLFRLMMTMLNQKFFYFSFVVQKVKSVTPADSLLLPSFSFTASKLGESFWGVLQSTQQLKDWRKKWCWAKYSLCSLSYPLRQGNKQYAWGSFSHILPP